MGQTVVPFFTAVGAKASDNVTPFSQVFALPAAPAIGDVHLLVGCTDNDAAGTVSISAPNGGAWTAVSGTPIGVAAGEKAWVWWRRHATGDGDPTVDSSADSLMGGIAGWRNCVNQGSPINVVETGSESTSDLTLSFATSVSTTRDSCMVLLISTSGQDSNAAQHSNQANSNLGNVAERVDYQSTAGAGGGFQIAEGSLIVPGVIGTWTADLANNSPKAYLVLALIGADLPYSQPCNFQDPGML